MMVSNRESPFPVGYFKWIFHSKLLRYLCVGRPKVVGALNLAFFSSELPDESPTQTQNNYVAPVFTT